MIEALPHQTAYFAEQPVTVAFAPTVCNYFAVQGFAYLMFLNFLVRPHFAECRKRLPYSFEEALSSHRNYQTHYNILPDQGTASGASPCCRTPQVWDTTAL